MIEEKIEFITMLIKLFAQRFDLTFLQAYRYVSRHDGIEYAEEHYGILHTLSFDDMVNSLAAYCRRRGGALS